MQPDQQQRIMGYFIEEAKDHLNTIEQGLLNLQSTIEDPEMVNEVFRAAHSVKGGAAMLGLNGIQRVSHRLEDSFKILKETPIRVDQKLENLFLRAFDALQELLGQLQGPFGLTEDVANQIVAGVEPTFAELDQHLNQLAGVAGGVSQPAVDALREMELAPATQRLDDALEHLFRNDVPLRLREMLQLFKQPETDPVARQQLQELCRSLSSLGEQYQLHSWCQLVETARRAIAHPENSYRILAPIVIKDIKLAQELVLAGRSIEIVPCVQLCDLVPAPVAPLETMIQDDLSDLLAVTETTDALADAGLELSFDDLAVVSGDLNLSDELSSDLGDVELGGRHGPEVGMAELNSLADLFEGEMPELGLTWQQEEVLSDDAERVATETSLNGGDDANDFADLLFDEAESQSDAAVADDLSDLFGDDLDDLPTQATIATSVGSDTRVDDDFADLLGIRDEASTSDSFELDLNLDATADPFQAHPADFEFNANDADDAASMAGLNADAMPELGLDNAFGDLGDLFDALGENDLPDADPLQSSRSSLSDPWEAPSQEALDSDETPVDFDLADLSEVMPVDEAGEESNLSQDGLDNLLDDLLDLDDLGLSEGESSNDLTTGDFDDALLGSLDDPNLETGFELASDTTSSSESELDAHLADPWADDLFDSVSLETATSDGETTTSDLGDLFDGEDLDFSGEDLDLQDLNLESAFDLSSELADSGESFDLEQSLLPTPNIESSEVGANDLLTDDELLTPDAQLDFSETWLQPADGAELDLANDTAPDLALDLLNGDFQADPPELESDSLIFGVASASELTMDELILDPGAESSELEAELGADELIFDAAADSFSLEAEPGTGQPLFEGDADLSELESAGLIFDATDGVAEAATDADLNMSGLDELLDLGDNSAAIAESFSVEESAAAALFEFDAEASPLDADLSDAMFDFDSFSESTDLSNTGSAADFANLEELELGALSLDVEDDTQLDSALDFGDDSIPEAQMDLDNLALESFEFQGETQFDSELGAELGDLLDDSTVFETGETLPEFSDVGEVTDLDAFDAGFPDASNLDESEGLLADDLLETDALLVADDVILGGLDGADSSTPDVTSELDELDDLLTEPAFSVDSNEFGDLEDLLGDDNPDALADFNGLMDDASLLPGALSGVQAELVAPILESATTATSDDFSDLESLLANDLLDEDDAPSIPNSGIDDSEFDDLNDLLKEAEQKMGGSPTIKVGGGLAAGRRPARPGRVFSEQTMRVPVKHLDNLSNLVGELVVNRNSLEQDQERLRQSLDNLLYQVQQLSDVGQRMQDLYERSLLESSLLASRQGYRPSSLHVRSGDTTIVEPATDHMAGVEYDPLEMDRFTGFHSLSQEMIELIVRVRESSSDIEFIVDETEQVTRMFRQVTTQLQEGLTRSRMVPFAQTADRLPRAVRDISMKVGKQAELLIEGRETLIDKMILEQLYDPMTHLVNNAITHGIESPSVRLAAGKPASGRITIRAFHQGNQTIISVADDGAGIDIERVRAKAVEKGLISREDARTMSRLDIYDLLFHPGFSTKDQADDFSGRGVGMDVVRTSLSEIRGVINTDSTPGKGTSFTIRLPLTLSISKALCCISDRARIAFPMDGVEDMLDVPKERIQTNADNQPCIAWRDTILTVRPLADLLGYNRHLSRGNVYGGNQEDDMVSIVVLRSAGNFLALQVDQVMGEQEIVIKQLEGPVPKPVGVAGATVLGDGRIMPIADVLELIDLSMGRIRRDAGGSLWEQDGVAAIPEAPVAKTEPMVLIVDDSITVRELLSMTFNKVGYRVEQARDGQEAWEKLRSGLPCDIVFCDIEMPRMDGLELLSRIQKDVNLKHLPIAMLTSRGADRHRQMAASLGASGYFTKPYLEEALLDAAQRMLKGERLLTS